MTTDYIEDSEIGPGGEKHRAGADCWCEPKHDCCACDCEPCDSQPGCCACHRKPIPGAYMTVLKGYPIFWCQPCIEGKTQADIVLCWNAERLEYRCEHLTEEKR